MKIKSANITNMIKHTLFLTGGAVCDNGGVGHLGPGGARGRVPGQWAAPRAAVAAPEPQEPVIRQGGAGGTCGGSTESNGWTHSVLPESPRGFSPPDSHPKAWNYRPAHTEGEGQRRNLPLADA